MSARSYPNASGGTYSHVPLLHACISLIEPMLQPSGLATPNKARTASPLCLEDDRSVGGFLLYLLHRRLRGPGLYCLGDSAHTRNRDAMYKAMCKQRRFEGRATHVHCLGGPVQHKVRRSGFHFPGYKRYTYLIEKYRTLDFFVPSATAVKSEEADRLSLRVMTSINKRGHSCLSVHKQE